MADKTPSTRETVHHTRQISRMLQSRGKNATLGSIGEDNIPVIGNKINFPSRIKLLSSILLSYTSFVYFFKACLTHVNLSLHSQQ